MESVTWPWRHPTTEPPLATNQAKGARTIQPAEDEQVSNLADCQILLVPPHGRLADLVHLRLFRILVWHLFVSLVGIDPAQHRSLVEIIWLVCDHYLYINQPPLLMQSGANKTLFLLGIPLSISSTSLAHSSAPLPAIGSAQGTVWRLVSSSKESSGLSWLACTLASPLPRTLLDLW